VTGHFYGPFSHQFRRLAAFDARSQRRAVFCGGQAKSAASRMSLDIAQLVRASARWHIAILSKDAVAGHEHVTKIGWHARPSGVPGVRHDVAMRLLQRGVWVCSPRMVLPPIMGGCVSAGTGCEKAKRENERRRDSRSVLQRHESSPLLVEKRLPGESNSDQAPLNK
jgi:hypothetical protein